MMSIREEYKQTLVEENGLLDETFFNDLLPHVSSYKEETQNTTQYAVSVLHSIDVRGFKSDGEIHKQLVRYFELPCDNNGQCRINDSIYTVMFHKIFKLKKARAGLIFMSKSGWRVLKAEDFKDFALAFINLFLKTNTPGLHIIDRVFDALLEGNGYPEASLSNEYMQFNDCMYKIKTGEKLPFSFDVVPRIKYNLSMCDSEPISTPPPKFADFIQQITARDDEYEKFLYRFLARLVSPMDYGDYNGAFLYGSGSNGKSILLYLIKNLYQEEDISTKNLSDLNNRFGRSGLDRKHMIISHESSKVSPNSLALSTLKSILTDKNLHIEEKGKDGRDAQVDLKVIMASNEKINFDKENQAAMKRRVLVLPFKYVVPEEDRDLELLNKLLEEKNEIMAYLMHIMTSHHAELKTLKLPTTVQEACDIWFSSTNTSVTNKPEQEVLVTNWINNNLTFGGENRILQGDLLEKIKAEVSDTISPQTINKVLREKFNAKDQQSNGNRYWKDVSYNTKKLIHPFERFQ